MVQDDQGQHGFHHRDSARDNAGVVTTTGLQYQGLSPMVHRVLVDGNGGWRFESHPEPEGCSCTHAAQDSTGMVGGGFDMGPFRGVRCQNGVVVMRGMTG